MRFHWRPAAVVVAALTVAVVMGTMTREAKKAAPPRPEAPWSSLLPAGPCDPSHDRASDFVIDAHAHIFNAWDIPAREFVVQVLARPTDDAVAAAVRGVAGLVVNKLRREAVRPRTEIEELRRQLGDTAKAVPAFTPAPPKIEELLPSLPTTPRPTKIIVDELLEEIRHATDGGVPSEPFEKTLTAEQRDDLANYLTRLVGSFTHARGENARTLRTFFHDGPQLFVTAMVDYEYPLQAQSDPAPLSEQLEVNALAALANEGQLLPFAPFDPYRDVLESPEGHALALAKQAVETAGFVGVKLYPPIGFRPLGNDDSDFDEDGDRQLEAVARSAGHPELSATELRRRIDRRLLALFQWASERAVPILVHAGESNGLGARNNRMSSPGRWRGAMQTLGSLGIAPPRIMLGHFGGMTRLEDEVGSTWKSSFVDLVREYPQLYGDVSCFDTHDSKAVDGYFDDFITPPTQGRSVWSSLSYGSDWHMLFDVQPGEDTTQQVNHFRESLRCRISDADRARFFAGNAIEFLGLRKGRATRARLDAFYQRAGITPRWRPLVDALP